jgi:hypothetical protein
MYQALKNELAPQIKEICKKYGIKGTLSVRNHSTLCLTIQSGNIDFGKDTNGTINPYWYHEHHTGRALDFLKEVSAAMNKGNHDNSDIMTDYFDVGWYTDISIGRWNKPYHLTA